MGVYLTIDVEFPDRPANAEDAWQEILAALDRHGALATMFVQGKWAEAHPDRVRRIRDAGHLVGLHSYWHAAYPALSDAGVREDLDRGRTALWTAAGLEPQPWFRLPYGRGVDEQRITELLAAEGYTHVDWTLDPADWHQGNDADGVAGFLEREAPADDHPSVVLLHSWPRNNSSSSNNRPNARIKHPSVPHRRRRAQGRTRVPPFPHLADRARDC